MIHVEAYVSPVINGDNSSNNFQENKPEMQQAQK